MTPDDLLHALAQAQEERWPCVLATVVTAAGITGFEAGGKALIFGDRRVLGSLGSPGLELWIVDEALQALSGRVPVLKTCTPPVAEPGAELSLLLEPHLPAEALFIFGAGHCGQALCWLARQCGWHVTVVDDRQDLLASCDAQVVHAGPAAAFIAAHSWQAGDAIVLVGRNSQVDQEALAAALASPTWSYLGMIGSRKKVQAVFEAMRAQGFSSDLLSRIHAPVGLDIAADAPMEIAVSIMAEMMMVLRRRQGASMKD